MIPKNIATAFADKCKAVLLKYETPRRCKPRIPKQFVWMLQPHYGQKVPTGFCPVVKHFSDVKSDTLTIDAVARTFCLLEDMEAWIDKVESGLARHQDEIERQAAHKIARLNTFVAMR